MTTSYRYFAIAIMLSSAAAFAQKTPAQVQCKSTETQPECHHRLGCKANEELEDCQKRLLSCNAGESLADCEKRIGDKQANPANQNGNNGNNGNQGNQGNRNNGNDRGNERDHRDNDSGNERDHRDNNNRGRDNSNGDRDDRTWGRDRDNGDRTRDHRDSSGVSRRGSRDHRGFEANKKFGLGLELGEPSGLNGKVFVTPNSAIDFGVGAIYGYYYYGDGFHIYGDYLWHPTSLVSAAAFELPVYIGVGLRFWDFNYCYLNVCNYSGNATGIRVPIGLSFDFNNVPLDIFVQAVPVLDFLGGDYYNRYRDREHFGIDVSAGIRFWLK